MVKRSEKGTTKKGYKQLAERLERDAYIVEGEQGRLGAYDSKPIKLYEKAAKYRMRAKDFIRARSDFRHAAKVAQQWNKWKPGCIRAGEEERLNKNAERMDKLYGGKWRIRKKKTLETAAAGIIGIAGIGASLFFLFGNITGNVIGNLTQTNSSVIGACLFVIGVVCGYLYFKQK